MEKCIIKTWEHIYQEWFGLKKDFSKIIIPKKYDPQKYFVVIVAKGLTYKQVILSMHKKFRVSLKFDELFNRSFQDDDRSADNNDYLVLFNRRIEADEELKLLTSEQLEDMGHKGITLFERLLLEVFYFNETREHLDCKKKTICTGSGRHLIYWSGIDGILVLDWTYDAGYEWCRPRTAIF